jgi:hypothetical protein
MSKNQTPAIRDATGAYCRSLLDAILPAMRETARFHGYAIAVHGSLKRDIDLVAVPWTEHAVPPDELVRCLRGAVGGVLGNCLQIGEPGHKPHGRVAYTLVHPGFAGEIDLSVVAPSDPTG